MEIGFSKDLPVRTATAGVGGKNWPFTPAEAENRLQIELTPEIRKAWCERGTLLVEIDIGKGAFPVELIVPPEKLEIDGYAGFTIIQRRFKNLPGSRGYVQVKLGDITGGQVLLSMRTAEGTTLIDTTSVREGDELFFEFGGEPLTLRVIDLVNFLIGNDFGTFMVLTEDFSPGWRRIERLLRVLGSSDVTFVRNEKEHTGAEAAAHLRSKLRLGGTKVQIRTVGEFIDKVASSSATTGKPYLIKLPDGKTIPAREWLHEQAAGFAGDADGD